MLLCQFIPALVHAVKRLDSVLLGLRSGVLRIVSRVRMDGEDLQEG